MKYSVKASQHISRYVILLVLFASAAAASVFSQAVDRAELEENQGAGIEFINYVGPHAIVESIDQIRNIGYSLGTAVKSGAAQSGDQERYFVIHSVSADDGTKLDADILGFGVDVSVDHIDNVRRIIQGYLEGAYDYSVDDAALLARYITIYNAVYRSNIEYFTSAYKTPVIENLTADKAGLSIRYDEWPGRTLMVIPLMVGEAGSLSAIDTTSITDENVIDEMRQEDDMGLDDRKEMVDLKEREAEEAAQEAEAQREAIAEEESRIAEERQQIEEEQQLIADQREEAAAIEDPEEREAAEEEIAEREEAVAEREEQVAEDEAALEEDKAEAEETQALADTKAEEAQADRQDIAEDQQTIIEEEENAAAAAASSGILGLSMRDASSPLGSIVIINPDSGEQMKTSALNTISARTFTIVGEKLIAVAGENTGSGAIRLVEIDPVTLEIKSQGNDDIDANSYLWQNGSDLYAIVSSGGKRYLARFDQTFAKSAQSTVDVHQWASVSFQEDFILTQRPDGSVLLLNTGDLTEKPLR
jgi:multidrug efflux pump subunit AcrA (membrane-fusion protein)